MALTRLTPTAEAIGAAHRGDAERVPLARALGRRLAEELQDDAAAPLVAGHRLSAADLGRAAGAARPDLLVARRPTVAVFTVGNGLRPLGQALADGERHDALRPLLIGLLQEEGIEAVSWPAMPAEPGLVRGALDDAAQAFDVVVCSIDEAAAALPSLWPEGERLLDDVTCGGMPVRVLAFGPRAPRTLLLGLPHDLAEAQVAWSAVGAPMLAAMQGARRRPPSVDPASSALAPDLGMAEVDDLLAAGARLIDIREPDEQALGSPVGAELRPMAVLPAPESPAWSEVPFTLLICASGQRSRRAVDALRAAGVDKVASVAGGLVAWRAAGRGIAGAGAAAGVDADALERYDRHLRLREVGVEGQSRLLASRVLIVGAGGLGSPAAFYLAAAGVGHLRLVDDDRVERSNLQRQILHVDADVGRPKVASAAERLRALNPRIAIEAIEARLGADNVEALLRDVDLVIDGSDNFEARYLVNAACVRLGKPLVHGAVERFTGHVAVFDAGRHRGVAPCYRCLFPEPPGEDAAPNCAQAGVLGVLPGLVGLLQATEALKLLLRFGEPLVGRLLTIDARSMRFRELALPVDPGCGTCAPDAPFDGHPAIEASCASRPAERGVR